MKTVEERLSPPQCNVINPCPSITPYRCNDNRCVVSASQCSSRNTCPGKNAQRCRYGRNNGMCFDLGDTRACEEEAICSFDKPVLYVVAHRSHP